MNESEIRQQPEDALDTFRDLQQEALNAMEQCQAIEPLRCQAEVDVAERAIIALRDGLIAALRQKAWGGQESVLRDALSRANVALSAIIGVEYPATGSQRTALDMAHDTLAGIDFRALAGG